MGVWSFPVTASFPSNVSLTHCASALGEGMTQEKTSLSLPVSTEQAEPLSAPSSTSFTCSKVPHIPSLLERKVWPSFGIFQISYPVLLIPTLRSQYKFTSCKGLPFHSLCWSLFQPVEYTMMVSDSWMAFRNLLPLHLSNVGLEQELRPTISVTFPKSSSKINIQLSHSFHTVIGQILEMIIKPG